MPVQPNIRTLFADAGRMRCQLSFESNGPAARTMKIKAVARTSEPIEVHGWQTPDNPTGRLIHDLSGHRLRKSPIPMMVNHGASVIGEWTRLEIQDGNLVAYGVLKSTEAGDIAATLMGKLSAGLPHEASINFGDEMTIEEYVAGESVFVNGRAYEGPATVVRLFFIREISLCGLGADPLTSATMDDGAESKRVTEPANDGHDNAVYTFSATVRDRTHATLDTSHRAASHIEVHALSEADRQPDGVPPHRLDGRGGEGAGAGSGAGEGAGPVALSEATAPAPEAEPAEAKAVDAVPVVEGPGETKQERPLSASMLKAWADEFGEALAVAYCLEGLDETQARARFGEHLKAELAKSQELVKHLSQHADPRVDFIPSDDPRHAIALKAKEYERKGLSKGEAAFAARLNR